MPQTWRIPFPFYILLVWSIYWGKFAQGPIQIFAMWDTWALQSWNLCKYGPHLYGKVITWTGHRFFYTVVRSLKNHKILLPKFRGSPTWKCSTIVVLVNIVNKFNKCSIRRSNTASCKQIIKCRKVYSNPSYHKYTHSQNLDQEYLV